MSSGCCIFNDFVIFHKIQHAKHIRDPCSHLVAVTGSWFIPIGLILSMYLIWRKIYVVHYANYFYFIFKNKTQSCFVPTIYLYCFERIHCWCGLVCHRCRRNDQIAWNDNQNLAERIRLLKSVKMLSALPDFGCHSIQSDHGAFTIQGACAKIGKWSFFFIKALGLNGYR